MTGLLQPMLSHPLAHAVGAGLLHSLWQVTAVALLVAAVLFALRRRTAPRREVVACAGRVAMGIYEYVPSINELLVAMGILPAFTALWVLEPLTASPLMPSVAGPGSSSSMSTPTALVEAVQPWLVPVWLLGVTALSLRFAGGWLQVQRLRYHSTSPATAAVSDAVRRLSARLGLRRRVSVLRSPRVAGPLTLGWLRPAILLPASTLSGLDPRQLELVLAHELAHVRRHDYLVNLLQSVAEILLFFHPAAWWLSRRIREEREMCCDDVAVATCGDPVSLARALATLEQHRATRVGLVAAATGGSLLVRVRRLLGMPSTPDPRPSGWVSLLLVVGLLMAIGSGLQRRAEATVHEGPLAPPAPAPIALPPLPAAPARAAQPAHPAGLGVHPRRHRPGARRAARTAGSASRTRTARRTVAAIATGRARATHTAASCRRRGRPCTATDPTPAARAGRRGDPSLPGRPRHPGPPADRGGGPGPHRGQPGGVGPLRRAGRGLG